MAKLKGAATEAKEALSHSHKHTVELDALFEGEDLSVTLTRARFEERCGDHFQRVIGPLEQVQQDARLEKSAIDDAVLVGGSTRIPEVQRIVDGKTLSKAINADEAVAQSAAAVVTMLMHDDSVPEVVLDDISPLTIGMALHNGSTQGR